MTSRNSVHPVFPFRDQHPDHSFFGTPEQKIEVMRQRLLLVKDHLSRSGLLFNTDTEIVFFYTFLLTTTKIISSPLSLSFSFLFFCFVLAFFYPFSSRQQRNKSYSRYFDRTSRWLSRNRRL